MALHDFADGLWWHRTFVEFEDGDQQSDFDVRFFGSGGFHLREDFQGLFLGLFIVVKILLTR